MELYAFAFLRNLATMRFYGLLWRYMDLWKKANLLHIVGLPCHLKDLGLDDVSDEELLEMIDDSMSKKYSMNRMPMVIQRDDVLEAIRLVDAFE